MVIVRLTAADRLRTNHYRGIRRFGEHANSAARRIREHVAEGSCRRGLVTRGAQVAMRRKLRFSQRHRVSAPLLAEDYTVTEVNGRPRSQIGQCKGGLAISPVVVPSRENSAWF